MSEHEHANNSEDAAVSDLKDESAGIGETSGHPVAGERPEQVFEYARAPESRSVVHLRSSYGLFLDGAFVEPVDAKSYKTENPATEEVLAEIAVAGVEDVDRAVQAAGVAARPGTEPKGSRECRRVLVELIPAHAAAPRGS